MSSGPRKISDVILDLESKIDILLGLSRSQDLVIKLLSNKMNDIINNMQLNKVPGKISIEAVNTTPKTIEVSPETKLPMQDLPEGFRRTSRPETYSGDNKYLPTDQGVVKFPMQLPKQQKLPEAEVIVPTPVKQEVKKVIPQAISNQVISNAIPVMQRIVDSTGKSIFLADVEISNIDSSMPTVKSRTNGTGKWMATLAPGSYKVVIRKRESLTKEKLESVQEISVTGSISPLELQTLIMR